VLTGLSAGSLCWFETGSTDSFGGLAPLSRGLGFLAGSHSPHYDGEETRRPHYHRLVADGTLPAGYAADDGAALVFRGTELAEVVASRPNARGLSRGARTGRHGRRDGATDPLPRLRLRSDRGGSHRRRFGSHSRSHGPRRVPPSRSRRRRAVSTVSPQPGGTSRGTRSASGASTNKRDRAAGCGTARTLAAFAGSFSASIERTSGGRSMLTRAARRRADRDRARAGPSARGSGGRTPLERLERGQQGDRPRSGSGGRGRRGRRRHCGTRAGR
jgi:hypothetical protein